MKHWLRTYSSSQTTDNSDGRQSCDDPINKSLLLVDSRRWTQILSCTNLYSSLTPYATFKSGSAFITSTAAAFMRSSARRSFGFSKPYLSDSLDYAGGQGDQVVRIVLCFVFCAWSRKKKKKKRKASKKRRRKARKKKAMETEVKKKKNQALWVNPTNCDVALVYRRVLTRLNSIASLSNRI